MLVLALFPNSSRRRNAVGKFEEKDALFDRRGREADRLFEADVVFERSWQILPTMVILRYEHDEYIVT